EEDAARAVELTGHIDRLSVVDCRIGIAEARIDARTGFRVFDGVIAADALKLAPNFFAGGGIVVEPEELGFQAVALELQRPGFFRAEASKAERGRSLVIKDDRIERFDGVDAKVAATAARPLRRKDGSGDDDQAARFFGDPTFEQLHLQLVQLLP